MVASVLWLAMAFLSGSIPFGMLIGWYHGVDVRRHGSGNIGATNVGRVLGLRWGLLCFVLDWIKGFAPVLGYGLAHGLVPASLFNRPLASEQAWLWMGVLVAAVFGHMFSPWLKFHGGKGVATGLGAVLAVFPYLAVPALGALVLWGVLIWRTRYMSLSSLAGAVALPALAWAWARVSERLGGASAWDAGMVPMYVCTVAVGAVVIIRHAGNIRRLLAGTENRLGLPRT